MSWFGGFAGGIAAGVVGLVRRRLRIAATLSAAAPAVALGQAVGRVGCFLVGDDYGRPTELPWGVAFPRGLPPTLVPVHPTQLYEAVLLLVFVGILIRARRSGLSDAVMVAVFLIGAGAIRFGIEFIRVDRPVALGLSVAHWASGTCILAGALLALVARHSTAGGAGEGAVPSNA
jgi:phosphatidylglycerol:prolipoprotein diacylglycerol transferase